MTVAHGSYRQFDKSKWWKVIIFIGFLHLILLYALLCMGPSGKLNNVALECTKKVVELGI